jgi:hypothetical protein
MTLSLEDRLTAAGEQLDALIELEQPVLLGVAEGRGREPRAAAMLVSLCAVILVAIGLVWATRPDESVQTPAADTSVPTPTTSVTTPPITMATSEPSSSSVPSVTVAPAPSTTIPVDERQPVAIGESVMMGAIPQLEAGGFAAFVDVSWQGADIADLVDQLAAAEQVGRTVVIHAGTNGPISADVYHRIADALVEADQLVFLTVHADRAWIPGNNENIWSLPLQYPNVTVLDWDGLVSSGNVPGMAGDGIHLNTLDAKQFYANYIFAAIGRNDLVRPVAGAVSASDLSRVLPPIASTDVDAARSGQTLLVGDDGEEVVDDHGQLCLRVTNDDGSLGGACASDPSAGVLTLGTGRLQTPSRWFFLINSTVSVESAVGCAITQHTSANLTLVRCEGTGDVDAASIVFASPDGRRYATTVPVSGPPGPVTP